MSSSKSMTDIAYDVLSGKKRSVPFIKIWNEVSKNFDLSEESMAQLYTDLTLDPRFVSLKDNKWDLKQRRTYEESHVDIDEISVDDEYEEEGFEEEEDY